MSEPSGILPSGSDADLQEQGVPDQPADTASGGLVHAGTGGSEADRLEQGLPTDTDDTASGGGITGGGTGGSEADRLEQAADVPLDGEDAFSRGAVDDEPTP